jgi:hypothetical protein
MAPLDRAKKICDDFYKQKTLETALLEDDLLHGRAGAILETPSLVAVLANAEYSRSEARRESLRHLV